MTPIAAPATPDEQRSATLGARLARLQTLAPDLWDWQFWLALALAALLRLWLPGTSTFLDDQAGVMALARGAVTAGAIPATSIPSSIGTLNPPLVEYLVLPFAALTRDPLPVVLSIAVWNVLGVAFAYALARRAFGRGVAAVGALLLATAGQAVNFSRFIWEQNYLPALLALWGLALFLWCVRGRRGWFVAQVGLLTAAALLHPAALLLAPVMIAGLLLAPHRPQAREWLGAGLLVALLVLPTVIWELASGGSDVAIFASYAGQRSIVNLAVLRALGGILGAPGSGDLGPTSLYARIGPWAPFISGGMVLAFVAGYLALTLRVFAPAWRRWRAGDGGDGRGAAELVTWARTLVGDVRGGSAAWRAHALLWLWVTLPLALLVRHSTQIFGHYLLILYPALFLTAGLWLRWLPTLYGASGRAIPWRRVARALPLALLALLIAGQTAESALYPLAIATGQFTAAGYGEPLAALTALDQRLTQLAAEQGATSTVIVLPASVRYRLPEEYLLLRERPARIGLTPGCLVLPAPGAGPELAVLTDPHGPEAALLASLPDAVALRGLALPGGDRVALYSIGYAPGARPTLPGEHLLAPLTFADGAAGGLRLDAVTHGTAGGLWLRWTILGSTPATHPGRIYAAQVQTTSATSAITCAPGRWQAGETLLTWVASDALPACGTATHVQASIAVQAGTPTSQIVPFGPLRLLADRPTPPTLAPLPLAAGASSTVALPPCP